MRVAISQRVDEVPLFRERRDGLDQRWGPTIEALGLVPVPVPNGLLDPLTWARTLGIQGLLLTGGNDLCSLPESKGQAPERDRLEARLLDLADSAKWPVLGVCRGMQKMNTHLGGRVRALSGNVSTRHYVHRTNRPARLLGHFLESMEVNSFHAYGVGPDDLAQTLVPIMADDLGFVEAVEHKHLPWAAIMWHPEREGTPSVTDRVIFSKIFNHYG